MSARAVESVKLDKIDLGKRLRYPDKEDVRLLSLSLKECETLINPIKLRPNPEAEGRFLLVSGATRLEAARLLGWEDIDAIVQDMSAENAELEEVDENLYRAELIASHRTGFVAKRLSFFELKAGKLRRGRASHKSANLAHLRDDNSPETRQFYDEINERSGIKRRTAQRLVRRARNITAELWEIINQNPKKYPGSLLDKITEISEEDRAEIVRRVKVDGLTIAAAVKVVRAPSEEEIHNRQKSALLKAWAAASPEIQEEFRRGILSERKKK
jgi:ParB family chromosome partitioning protein